MVKKALVTGSGGLIGSEASRFLLKKGYEVQGIDNNLRKYFFGEKGDTTGNVEWLRENFSLFCNNDIDIRSEDDVNRLFKENGPFEIIIHTAAQPSHDWAAKEPITDFTINANGTLNLLEATRKFSPEATFIFTSTNKVYGDAPNDIPMKEIESRWEYNLNGIFKRPELKKGISEEGINELMTIDQSKHSAFGASKVAADIMVQEYGKNKALGNLKTGVFRGGCLTGPQHSAVELHGFLNYIVGCAVDGTHYTIFGYKGKQVRDQIHTSDVVNAFWEFHKNPRRGEVYNLGGCRENSVSIIEIIKMLDKDFGLSLNHTYSPENRIGDHICYYSDMSKFKEHYPEWKIEKSIKEIVSEIIEVKK